MLKDTCGKGEGKGNGGKGERASNHMQAKEENSEEKELRG